MSTAPGALQQPRDPFGRADLQHALDRQEVDPEVERGGCDDRLQPAFLQAELDPLAHVLVERAVVQRDHAGPLGPLLEQQLVPGLGLRAHVDEDERRRGLFDLGDHRQLHLLAQVATPRESPRLLGQQRVDHERLVDAALDQHRRIALRAAADQHLHRLVEVAERRAQAPDDQLRVPALQPGERELHLHTALVAHQLMPFVDDHRVHARQLGACVVARQHQAQRLGGRDERGRELAVLARAFGRQRVAGAHADRPVAGLVRQRQAQRACRIGGQRAHRRQPKHAERRCVHAVQRHTECLGTACTHRRSACCG